MKRKVLSTVVVSALIAAQMAMSVVAAPQNVDINVTTKNAVIRVQVPTKLEVAVDEFETVGDGSQVYSEEFTMKNLSTVPVYVKTVSKAAVGSGVTLKATKAEVVADENGDGNAWLAVAAQTAAGKYGSGTVGDLTEANGNVTTLDATNGATQEFYLDKGSGATKYTLLDAANPPATMPSYSEFYALTEQAADSAGIAGATESTSVFNADSADAGAATKNDDILKALVDSKEVYAVDGSNVITKLTSGSTITYSSSNTYYVAAVTPTDVGSLGSTAKYVYAEASTAGGQAAYRFIGKLSTGKTGGWIATDLGTVSMTYEITGVQGSAYDTVKDSCTYGLYKEAAISLSTDGVITITNFNGAKYKSLSINDGNEDFVINDADPAEGEWVWESDDASSVKTFTLGSNWTSYIPGKTITVTINLTDGTTLQSTAVAIPSTTP